MVIEEIFAFSMKHILDFFVVGIIAYALYNYFKNRSQKDKEKGEPLSKSVDKEINNMEVKK